MMIFLQIAGGVALTIFGIRFLRKGLERLFGGKLVAWLSHMTQRRWKAFLSGMVVGTLAPSSTAISLITLQMLNTGQLTAERMLAVLLGSNVGITVTVQLLAFHVQDYAGLFILLGVLGFQFLNREVLRGVGQCLLSLGFIFLAMRLIGDGAAAMSLDQASSQWLQLFAGHPLLTFIFVSGFTVCVQSSTASIGFAIALCASGLFSAELLIPWVLGANVGISLTALAAGWPTLEGRRLAMANLLVKLCFALPLLLLPSLAMQILSNLPGSPTREIANFHTGFNLLIGIIAIPFLGPITRFVRMMVVPPQTTTGLPEIESYLDPQALDTPSLALANATRETLRMADGVKLMLQYFWQGYSVRDLHLMLRVQNEDDRADNYNRDIKDYLSRIREGMTEEEIRWQFALLTFSNELESVGDVIDKNLCDTLRKQTAEGVYLSSEDYAALCELYERVMARFNVAMGFLANRGGSQVKGFLSGKESLNEWCRQAQRQHYERLRAGTAQGVVASAYFLDILNGFRRINSHISTIGYAVAPPSGRRKAPVRMPENP
ncbi:MAG: Na/Pi cotransporter family protein [Terrimicrobiaceae bacterium]